MIQELENSFVGHVSCRLEKSSRTDDSPPRTMGLSEFQTSKGEHGVGNAEKARHELWESKRARDIGR